MDTYIGDTNIETMYKKSRLAARTSYFHVAPSDYTCSLGSTVDYDYEPSDGSSLQALLHCHCVTDSTFHLLVSVGYNSVLS